MDFFENEYAHKMIEPFKFWCHKVIPLVYDDSLSYYEVLCKVVNYINNMITDLNKMGGTVNTYTATVNELRDFVTHYFDNLDVQDEINNKLDAMAIDGTLTSLLDEFTFKPVTSIMCGRNLTPDANWDYTTNLFDVGYDEWIGMWDELVRTTRLIKHTTSYTASGFGGERDTRNMVYYEWKPRNLNFATPDHITNYEASSETTPGFLITGGIHGNEKQAPYAFYNLFKSWLNGGNYGRYMLDNFYFIIVPCANPYGWEFNKRRNENNVNINRNFKYGWVAYESTEKGSAPNSETETQFLQDIINMYSAPKYRSSFVCIDLHGFHRYLHNDDNRLFWVVANDYQLKRDSLKLISYLDEAVCQKYPAFALDNHMNYWGSQVSTPDYDNQCRVQGLRSLVFECPQNFTGTAETESTTEYDEMSAWISYLIVPNVIINLSDLCFERWQNKQFNRSDLIGCIPGSYTLKNIAENLPSGSTITLSIASDSVIAKYMPTFDGNRHTGILRVVNNGGTSLSPSCVMYFTITDTNNAYTWAKTFSQSGTEHPWTTKNNVMSIFDVCERYNVGKSSDSADYVTPNTITIRQLMAGVPDGCVLECYTSQEDIPSLYAICGRAFASVVNPHSTYARKMLKWCDINNNKLCVSLYDGTNFTPIIS